jgi:hypothetical protein
MRASASRALPVESVGRGRAGQNEPMNWRVRELRRSLRGRELRRDLRGRTKAVAWWFIASPALVLAFGGGRYSVWQAAALPVIGVVMLLWLNRRPGAPEHIAAVELVRPDDYHGPDAKLDAFYLPWCDCGWFGDDHADAHSARAEARQHTPHVRPGLRAWGK